MVMFGSFPHFLFSTFWEAVSFYESARIAAPGKGQWLALNQLRTAGWWRCGRGRCGSGASRLVAIQPPDGQRAEYEWIERD
jgi:hypothetical protein